LVTILALQFELALCSALIEVVMVSYCCLTNSTTLEESPEMTPADDLWGIYKVV
jgi:hypothetical protein